MCGHEDTDFGSCKTWGQDYTNQPCTKRLAWGIACGVISALVALLWHIPRTRGLLEAHKKVIAIVLGVWWVFGVGFLTFGGPFATPNNGYFAAWGAAVCSWVIAYDGMLEEDDDADSQDGEDYVAAAAGSDGEV